jgi:REP element-mobilizing transposase RayT
MSQRKYSFVPGEFYHLYNRGTDKRVVFQDDRDYHRFIELLHIANNTERINVRDLHRDGENLFDYNVTDRLVSIGAYCLMPNHFHLLVTPVTDDGLSTFMQKLSTSYVMYFNKKYGRTGALFEGKFKSELAQEDRYLKYLFSYIHLNPVKLIQRDWKEVGLRNVVEAEQFLNNYTYSSYPEYTGRNRNQSVILNRTPFPVYFESISAAEREVKDWLTFP